MYYLYLDDERIPKTNHDWVICRSVQEAIDYITKNGMPIYISFDHDLGEDVPCGYDLVKWIVENILDGKFKFPDGFWFNVHSANPVGAENITSMMINILDYQKNQ